jgi:hypothetical protein
MIARLVLEWRKSGARRLDCPLTHAANTIAGIVFEIH